MESRRGENGGEGRSIKRYEEMRREGKNGTMEEKGEEETREWKRDEGETR